MPAAVPLRWGSDEPREPNHKRRVRVGSTEWRAAWHAGILGFLPKMDFSTEQRAALDSLTSHLLVFAILSWFLSLGFLLLVCPCGFL